MVTGFITSILSIIININSRSPFSIILYTHIFIEPGSSSSEAHCTCAQDISANAKTLIFTATLTCGNLVTKVRRKLRKEGIHIPDE